jgi:hypothetical protein
VTTVTILADNGVSSGTSGLKTSGGNDGTLALQTTNSSGTALTGLTIDANQNVSLPNSLNAANTFGFKNRVINGGMVVNQRNTTVTYGSGGVNAYCIDQFKGSKSNTGTFTLQQSTTAPTGFTKSLLLTVTGTESSLASNSFYDVVHYIEGNNIADFAWGSSSAKTVTLSFWVRSSVTGIYSFELRNGANNRSITYNYTIAAANTWQQVTQTITGDTTGTWATDTGSGIEILFPVATGSSFTTGTTGVWQANNSNASTSAINLMATNGATWYLTGVQLEVGTQATSFDFRSYGTELALCQRYYYKLSSNSANATTFMSPGVAYNTTQSAQHYCGFPVTMRTAPTASIGGSVVLYVNASTNTITSIATQNCSPTQGTLNFNVAAGLTAGTYYIPICQNTTAYFDFSAEL